MTEQGLDAACAGPHSSLGWVVPRAGDLWVQLPVVELTKQEVTDGGALLLVHKNVLDFDTVMGLYAKPFVHLFEGRFYYWASVEILRKLLQTSTVVVVRIVSPEYDLLYMLLVSYIFITIQGYYSPFKEDSNDKLSIAFLVNEFIIMLSLVGITYIDNWNEKVNGCCLLILQVRPAA
eukprot:2706745-Pyramimonas_sp.AAC.1